MESIVEEVVVCAEYGEDSDGNCLFRSVSLCLYETDEYHLDLRIKVSDVQHQAKRYMLGRQC